MTSQSVSADVKADRRKARLEQKKALLERRASRPLADITMDLKKHWEVIRQKDIPTLDKKPHLDAIFTALKGNESNLATKRETSRIIQSAITYASVQDRVLLTTALCSNKEIPLWDLAASIFARHLLNKLVKDCQKCRQIIIDNIRGNLYRFLKSRRAILFLDIIFEELNTTKRFALIKEVYMASLEISNLSSDSITSVSQLLLNDPNKREVVIKSLRKWIESFHLKEMYTSPITHRILNDYLTVEAPKPLEKTIELLLGKPDMILLLTSTSDGCEAIVRMISAGSARDRKTVVKKFKGSIHKLLADAGQSQIISAMILLIDDTVLIGKALIQGELLPLLDQMIISKIGVRPILAILSGNTPHLITNQFSSFLKVIHCTSRKDETVRRSELLPMLKEPLLESLSKDENLQICMSDQHLALLLVETAIAYPESSFSSDLVNKVIGSKSLLEAFELKPISVMLRSMISRSESLALQIFEVCDKNLEVCLESDAGFLLVSMTKYPSITCLLRNRLQAIETVQHQSAMLLKSKL